MGPDETTDLSNAAAKGVASLFNIDPLVTVLVLAIMALLWLVRYLIQRNQEQGDKITDALINNTAVVAEFKEMVRALIAQKG